MSRVGNIIALFAALLAAVYQFWFKEVLLIAGYNRVVESVGNKNCRKVPDLRACEKLVVHQPSGHVYLACSETHLRLKWLPSTMYFNTEGASKDYIAIYEPETSKITKLKFTGHKNSQGFSSHGMDVVPSASNPSESFVYIVNHRPPIGVDPVTTGADSVLEIFKHTSGSDELTHIKTFESPLIITPNDVVGSDDGQSLYFTNDNGRKIGFARPLDSFRKATSVVYCHVKEGCKYAIKDMNGNNGIVRASNGTLYVAGCVYGGLTVLEEQSDNTLVITDHIKTDRGMDNLSIDSEGHVWAAAFPKIIKLMTETFVDPNVLVPSSALRFSINTGPGAFYGEKYKVEKLFEDDGQFASGSTTVAYDAQRKTIFLHGEFIP
ncbi:serum paraoxonase/arylesterase [Macrolepiota fuliginosa MF-IS2]|uniref:Serum paraoxonase/arylesterase n=1 Tax=Macrolepiota fuliginosa MF-IS2 TaxID=1400762 RepID=A0A9P5XED6_9AGAR|nr:serum paraoxonase/arylesterase [Macrolepiota fuliginosa MF-IS2]